MKLHLAMLAATAACAAFAADFKDEDYDWYTGDDLPLEGKAFKDTDGYFTRIPASYKEKVTPQVLGMSYHSTGMTLRFVAQSDKVAIKWKTKNTWEWTADHYMCICVHSEMDYYLREPGSDKWSYRQQLAVDKDGVGRQLMQWLRPGTVVLVHLPVRGVVESLELGVPKGGAKYTAAPAHTLAAKPIVHYGTSIVHGGCVTRPGLVFTSQAARQADVEVVNLGFSGAGRMEMAMAEMLAEADASCYVLDCLWNMDMKMTEERYEPFIRALRKARPDVPIVMCEKCSTDDWDSDGSKFVRSLYARLVAEGWRNLTLLPAKEMMPLDPDLTLDHIHPNDAGSRYMGVAYARAYERALGKK